MSDPPLTYGSYLKVPELLSLQRCLTQPPHHDETLFIVIHQVYELWFKQVLHEVDSAICELDADRVHEASRLLRRVVEIQRVLVAQVKVLETMRPQDFLGFRYNLNPASGFQSVQFRELEFALGMKRPEFLQQLRSEPAEKARLEARLQARSLPDAFFALLERRLGPLKGADARVAALARLYETEDPPDLVALCEVLMDIDENLTLWRAHHVQMVERMIGSKRGTGGSEGVAYLQSTLPSRAFPELWSARTRLGQEPR
jgi:tryptophan 2,3-dioxygenase